MKSTRLAIIVSHPIQYYSPWFRYLANQPDWDVRVFYLWNFGVVQQTDRTFGREFVWDIPLLDGYDSCFVANRSRDPGTHHFGGLHNPTLLAEVRDFLPDAVLMFGYAWRSNLEFLVRRPRSLPVMMRGDTHRLASTAKHSSCISWLRTGPARWAIGRCNLALAVGKANAEFYRQCGLPKDRIVTAPHCVDNQRFAEQGCQAAGIRFRDSYGIPNDARVCLFVGKFETKKRPDLLIRAFRKLSRDDIALILVGDGPLAQELHALAQGDGRIHFVPFLNQSAIPAAYAAAEVLVLPSQGPGETWGLVVNEAMNCHCAIIVSSHVGCGPDLVQPGVNGWVFPAGSEECLRDALAEALQDRERLRRYALASAEFIQGYSYEAATQGLRVALTQL